MAGTLAKTNPTPVNVHNMLAAGTLGTASASQVQTVKLRVPLSTGGSTANAGLISWINPEAGTILVEEVVLYFSTTGTGTVDVGVSDDGTGSNGDVINGGTMSASVYAVRAYRGRTGTEGAGTLGMQDVLVLGPGGTGTDNSIVAKTAETASTARGALYITYHTVS